MYSLCTGYVPLISQVRDEMYLLCTAYVLNNAPFIYVVSMFSKINVMYLAQLVLYTELHKRYIYIT